MNRFLFLMMVIAGFVFILWLQNEQMKGIENHDTYKMQLEQRARVIERGRGAKYYD